jgi:hypothetical protein
MKRREFVASVIASGIAVPALAEQSHHHGRRVDGPNANASVSFGYWQQFDRFPTNNDRTRNGHELIPHVARVKAGGTVNFIIAGFHQVIVYGPGVKPDDINTSMLTSTTGTPPPGVMFPPLIDDPTGRVYRGLDPSTQPQDRVEVVHFPNRGLHLVICGVLPHFATDRMFGWVRVSG